MTVAKTSINFPLRIDAVRVNGTGGLIGMTLCPGKKDKGILSGPWDRDLDTDLEAIRRWGAKALVCLVEDFELEFLHVPDLPEKTAAFGIRWYHLPIVDLCAPDDDFEVVWERAGGELRRILQDGGRIVIHCRGGLGRTGTVVARLLVEFGVEPVEAIQLVRKARVGAIQTSSQEDYVWRLGNRQSR
jgi:ADP-ribosyl-[dinitrogen reductase] hydrolase